ncbi:inner membrane protein [Methylobacterium sp. GXF4]|uniref:DUF927 domain-containing protein n=1 Tax=Methylobacterium sp. GXF4 TaxID=1096546 RepID=UPI0002698C57|nr:DUF927 domain-containing protein [Methylobacterium sp. GXF4]EIZ87137.1 inner membrane protein [Methylobacterium sp. GXF4]
MALEAARIYLERVVPWIEGSHVNLHWTVPNRKFDQSKPEGKGNKKFYLNGMAFTSPSAAIDQLTYLTGGRATAQDIYACMSSQQLAETKVVGGRSFLEAKRGTENVAGIKALYIDLDVKADSYATPAAAFGELRRFIAEVGLPRPTLAVASGTGGAHVYWVLDKVLPRAEWQPLANALAEATRRHGLKVDSNCTVDSARLLRVPETWNHKGNPPLPVVMGKAVQPNDVPLDEIRRILLPYMGATVVRLPTAKPLPGQPAMPVSELSAGIQAPQAPPIDIDSIKPLCGFVATALDTGGQSYAQPLWNLTTLLATFTQSARGDGRWAAHEMAKGHPGYDLGTTDALYDRKVAERDVRNIGWPSCSAVQNAGCTSCATCPLNHLNKSPLSFGQPVSVVSSGAAASPVGPGPGTVSAAPAAPHPLPSPYVYRPTGVIARATVQEDNTVKLFDVCPYPLHSAWVQTTPWVLHFKARLGVQGFDASMSIQLTHLNSREYAKHLAAQGLIVARQYGPLLQEFLMAWVHQLQQTRDAVVSSSPFGWSIVNDTLEGFVYDGRVWTGGTDKPAASPNQVIADQYTPRGSVEPWKEAAKVITSQGRPALDAILAGSFGAPLMRFTGQSGSVMSAYSISSGIGKSTTADVAQSVWGHPKKAMNSLSDTQNSVINKAGQLRSLPLIWDELKGEDQKEAFMRLAFQISGGKEKSRLNADSTQRDPGTWQTMVIVLANDSLLGSMQKKLRSTDAGILRVFEYEVPDPPAGALQNHGVVSRLIARCHENYGHAGLIYAKFLGSQHARCAAEMAKVQDALTVKLKARNDERFWIANMACCIQGARYANELGLTQIDVAGLTKFLIATLLTLRSQREAATVNIMRPDVLEGIIAQFLGEMAAKHTLTTDSIPQGPGRPKDCTALGDHTRLDAIYVRHAVNERIYVISQPVFHDWLTRRELPAFTLMKALRDAYPGAVRTGVLRDMTSGTKWFAGGMRTQTVEFHYAGTNFRKALGDVEDSTNLATALP